MESFLSAVLVLQVGVEGSLQRALFRAQVIVDEAAGRHIKNQAMLRQLDMLRDAIYRGSYILDSFRYKPQDEEEGGGTDQIPYSVQLMLDNCMFGRQTETQAVFSFLLHTQPHGSKELEILPIVGPAKVGKSTFVAHVCMNERVRDNFSEILFLRDHDLATYAADLSTFREGCETEHRNHKSNSNKDRGLLVIVDLAGDINEDAWNMLYSSCKQRMPSSSKILVTSRSDKIIKFGTTRALDLKYLSDEEFWYFFKNLTFGSMDPKMHPRLAHVAMEIAKMLRGCFVGANAYARMLRDNFDIHFWCKVLAFLRENIQKHVSKFGAHPFDLIKQNRPIHVGRMATPFEECVRYCGHDSSSQEEVPKIRLLDVIYGSVKAFGELEVLVWRSRIPPYYSYVVSLEIRELRTRAAKRKRSIRNEITPC
ncbi:hypothetical protein BS78_02G009700 [Paspalum vaginatum]|nr:hypothetical protein BS78_02G009700 [Paspalum vaginatum]